MKNKIVKLIIYLLFINFSSVYADSVQQDLYGKWISLSEETDCKNCKKLTIDGKRKCYPIHQRLSEYDYTEPNYVQINKKENYFEYRKEAADFAETAKLIYYKSENGKHLFRITGETTYSTPYECFYSIEKIDNEYLYYNNPFGLPVELYIGEEEADKLKILVITLEFPNN